MICQLPSIHPNSVVLIVTRKYSAVIVLKMYVTGDIISTNLVLIVLTLYRFSLQTFFECAKAIGGHAKN